jgi:hypothetical protein
VTSQEDSISGSILTAAWHAYPGTGDDLPLTRAAVSLRRSPIRTKAMQEPGLDHLREGDVGEEHSGQQQPTERREYALDAFHRNPRTLWRANE